MSLEISQSRETEKGWVEDNEEERGRRKGQKRETKRKTMRRYARPTGLQ